jgi:hypothetical protein
MEGCVRAGGTGVGRECRRYATRRELNEEQGSLGRNGSGMDGWMA